MKKSEIGNAISRIISNGKSDLLLSNKKIRREQISYSVKVMIISRIHFLIQKCEIWSFLFVTIYFLLGVGSVSSYHAAFLYPAFTK